MPIVTIPATGAVGLVADEAPQELPDGAWSSGSNVRFAHGYATRFTGHRSVLNTPSAAPHHIVNYRSGVGDFWVHATLAGAFADDGTTKTDISGTAFTGDADDIWTSTVLGGVLYLNNGKDVPVYWGGDVSGNVATITSVAASWAATTTCKAFRSFKANLIALNITKNGTNYPSMVKWSDSTEPGAVPTSWDETDATGDARELDLAETSDRVIDGLPLGDMFCVYKDASMWGLQATGGNDVFRYFRLPGDHGALSQNCIANYPGGHVVLTSSDIVTHSGSGAQSILDGRMRRWLFSRLDGTNFRRSFLVHNPAQSEVWCCFPNNGDDFATLALIWNYQGNTFGTRELPNLTAASVGPLDITASNVWNDDLEVWNDDSTTWNQLDVSQADKRMVCSSADSLLHLMDQTTQFNGVAFEARMQRIGMAFGDPSRVKLVKALYPRIEAAAGTVVYIQLGASMDAEQSPIWSAAVPYTVGSSYKADTFAQGRFISLRVYGSATRNWRIKSVDADVITKGAY